MTILAERRNWLLGGGVGAIALTILGGFVYPQQFFISWLMAEIFWLGLALGSLAWVMIHYLTGGRWGNPLRRVFESAMGTLPFLLAAFLPLLFGLRFLYPWAAGNPLSTDHVVQQHHIYMSGWAFGLRGLVVFGIWILLGWRLRNLSIQQDRTESVEPTKKLRALSGPGLVVYPLTATFAFVDWVMSTEPNWYSTVFPILICIGQMLSALSGGILILFLMRRQKSVEQCDRSGNVSTSRKSSSGHDDDVGLPGLFTALDYLVGRSSARDQLVSSSECRALEICGRLSFRISFRDPICSSAVAPQQKVYREAGIRRRHGSGGARNRCLVADHPVLPP